MSRPPVVTSAVIAALAVVLSVWFGTRQADVDDQPPLPPRAEVPAIAPVMTKSLETEPVEALADPGEGDASPQPDMRLLATTVSRSQPERNRAHVHDRTSKVRYVLAQDQKVPGYDKLRLVEIDDGRVVFDYDGVMLELFMDPEVAWPEDPDMRPPPVELTELVSLMKPIADGETEEAFRERYEHGLGKLYRMDLGLRTDDALFKHGVFAPKKVDGRQVGFYASRINKGSFWDTLGLEAGDVILEVNGIPIEGPESNRDAAKEIMRSETQIKLTVERNGELFETSTQTLPVASGVWSAQPHPDED